MFKRKQNGFTIVELLIVIVVIAILAAITVLAFNGVRKRALSSSNSALIGAYKKSFKLLQAETGSLPMVNACLGTPSAYPSGCSMGGQTGTVQASINSQLASYGMNESSQKLLTHSTSLSPLMMYSPGYYGRDSILWHLPPDEDCPYPVVSYNGTSWGMYGAGFTGRNPTYTFCASPVL